MDTKLIITLFVIGLAGGFVGAFLFQSMHSSNSLASDQIVSIPLTEIGPNQLMQKMSNNDTDFIIVDVRDKQSYSLGHVKGAISFTQDDLKNKSIVDQLPKDKTLVVMCWSAECMLGPTVASSLVQMGFTNVKELRIGWCEWAERGYPIEGKRYIVPNGCYVPQRSINNEPVEIIDSVSAFCQTNSTSC